MSAKRTYTSVQKLKKECSHCGKKKLLSKFYHNSMTGDYHNDICAKCQIDMTKQINKQNKDILLETAA